MSYYKFIGVLIIVVILWITIKSFEPFTIEDNLAYPTYKHLPGQPDYLVPIKHLFRHSLDTVRPVIANSPQSI